MTILLKAWYRLKAIPTKIPFYMYISLIMSGKGRANFSYILVIQPWTSRIQTSKNIWVALIRLDQFLKKKGSKTGWVGQRRESERIWYSNEYDPNTVYGTFKVLV